MGLRINTNVPALNATRQLNRTMLRLSKSLERLSSGLRINRAADDAARHRRGVPFLGAWFSGSAA